MGLAYQAFNQQVFKCIPVNAISILDVGCGTGAMGKALLALNPEKRIIGITYSPEEKKEAESYYDEVILHDLDDLSLQLNEHFDVIIFSHVLEHTMQPLKILKHYLHCLKVGALVIVAVPNVMFYKQRWQFLKGNFQYNPNGGVMDSTHLRFFDFASAKKLIIDSGLTLKYAEGFGGFPQPFTRPLFPGMASKIDKMAPKLIPGLFSSQFVMVGKKES